MDHMATEAPVSLQTQGPFNLQIASSNSPHVTREPIDVSKYGEPLREYIITHASKHSDLLIQTSTAPTDSTTALYVENSTGVGKPAMTLHQGSTNKGRILGVAIFPQFSNNLEIGLGDPTPGQEDLNTTTWTRLEKISAAANIYRFEVPVGYSSQRLLWKRTHSPNPRPGPSDASVFSKISMQHLKLVDESTDEVLATYTNHVGLSWNKKGTIRIWTDAGEGAWLKMLLLTALAIMERNRRM